MKSMVKAALLGTIIFSVCLFLGFDSAHALPLELNSLEHGAIVTDQFASQGVMVSVDNPNRWNDAALIFDTHATGTPDPDLEWDGSWATGNIAPDEDLGNLLIIAENVWDRNHDGLVVRPDDEGNRPAGTFYFDLDDMASEFSFDIVDVEGDVEEFSVDFYGEGALLGSIGFDDFLLRDGVSFGDNSANRIAPITAADLGLETLLFDKVAINMGGSGGITNLDFTSHTPAPPVPEPTTMLLVGTGILAIAALRKRRK